MFQNTRAIDQDYLKIVATSNVLLRGRIDDPAFAAEVEDVCRYQSDPQIGLILLSGKTTRALTVGGTTYPAGTYMFGGEDVVGLIDSGTTRDALVWGIMTSSAFSPGITRISAILTAAVLIGQIPLNSDLKQLDLATGIRNQALKELDMILQQIEAQPSAAVAATATDKAGAEGIERQVNIYFAPDIDPGSIDLAGVTPDATHGYVPPAGAQPYQALPAMPVGEGRRALVTITLMSDVDASRLTIPQIAIPLPAAETPYEDVVRLLAEGLNNAFVKTAQNTQNVTIPVYSNLVATPMKDIRSNMPFLKQKREWDWPHGPWGSDEVTPADPATPWYVSGTGINVPFYKIQLTARFRNAAAQFEVISISFESGLPDVNGAMPDKYIRGLTFGPVDANERATASLYGRMSRLGAVGASVYVEKATVATQSGGSTSQADSKYKKFDPYLYDTLYFQAVNPLNGINTDPLGLNPGDTTGPVEMICEMVTRYTTPGVQPRVRTFEFSGTSLEALATDLFDKVYTPDASIPESDDELVPAPVVTPPEPPSLVGTTTLARPYLYQDLMLASLPYSNAVQFAPKTREENEAHASITVRLKSSSPGRNIQVIPGNCVEKKSSLTGGSYSSTASVLIPYTALSGSQGGTMRTVQSKVNDLLANTDVTVTSVQRKRSAKLQAAYDRMDRLDNMNRGYDVRP